MQICGNEPALQCTTSRYCCRDGGMKGQCLKIGKWMYVSDWKDEKDLNSWNYFGSAELLLYLIFLTPVQSSAWHCFSRGIKTFDFQIFLGSSSSSFCMCSHEAANTTQEQRESYSGMWRKCSWLCQKSALQFKLLCSAFVVSAFCYLAAGNVKQFSNIWKEMEDGCWGGSPLLPPLPPQHISEYGECLARG